MTDAQRKALESAAPRYCVPYVKGRQFSFPELFGDDRPVVAEIGFGMGSATWQIALSRPSFNYLAFEVHTPGVGKLLSLIEEKGIDNIRIVHHDAVEAFEDAVPEASLAGLHVFYPDPWPKKRHHKRRLMREGIIELLVSRLAPGGYLYFVTDIEEYAEWTLALLSGQGGLRNRYEGLAPHQEWRPETKFEARASRDGRGVHEILFERV
jgi:tRNA (guanine-N7-)-methyltransferase